MRFLHVLSSLLVFSGSPVLARPAAAVAKLQPAAAYHYKAPHISKTLREKYYEHTFKNLDDGFSEEFYALVKADQIARNKPVADKERFKLLLSKGLRNNFFFIPSRYNYFLTKRSIKYLDDSYPEPDKTTKKRGRWSTKPDFGLKKTKNPMEPLETAVKYTVSRIKKMLKNQNGNTKVIILVRHGESESNVKTAEEKSRIYDCDLTSRGREDAIRLGGDLRDLVELLSLKADEIEYHTSPLKRAMKTTGIALKDLFLGERLKVNVDGMHREEIGPRSVSMVRSNPFDMHTMEELDGVDFVFNPKNVIAGSHQQERIGDPMTEWDREWRDLVPQHVMKEGRTETKTELKWRASAQLDKLFTGDKDYQLVVGHGHDLDEMIDEMGFGTEEERTRFGNGMLRVFVISRELKEEYQHLGVSAGSIRNPH